MAYDDVLPYLGEFGRYQKRIYVLLCLPAILCALHKLCGVFLQANVSHRCRLPYEHDNATYNLSLTEIGMVIPWDSTVENWSSCERLDVNFTEQYFNAGIPATGKTVKCHHWIYDTSVYKSSAVTEFNLVCDDSHFRVMADSLFMVGALLGSIIFGALSDRFGRRPIFFLSLVLQVTFGLLAAVAPEYFTFMFCRLIIGSTTSGVFLVAYVIAMEMVGPSKRLYAGVVCQFFFTAGYILTAGFAYFIKDWRYLQAALSAPGIIFLSYWWIVPESARWLLTRGRGDEAKELLLKAAKENKVTIPEDILDNLLPQNEVANGNPTEQESKNKKTAEKRSSLIDLFRYPNLRKKTLVILFSWFVNSGTYYGLSWNTSNLGGNDYLNFLLSGAVEIPGYSFLLFTLNRWGRKVPLCGCMVVGGIALLLTSVVPSDMNWLIITLAMIGKMVITASYGTVYVFSAEQFPTVVRNIGIGAASTSARIGGILAPYTLLLGDHWRPLPLLIYGAMALIGGISALLLPETLNKKLPDTIAEGEMFGMKHKKEFEEIDGSTHEMYKNSNSEGVKEKS